MAWDASFKNMLKKYLQSDEIEVITETEVPSANLRIDFILKAQVTLPSPFDFEGNPGVIVGEFKSQRDILNVHDLDLILAKTCLYRYSNQLLEKDTGIILLVGGRKFLPKKIVENYEFREVEKGIYQINRGCEFKIVLLDRITNIEPTQFLMLFASDQKRRELYKIALSKNESFIISYAYFLYKDEVLQVAKAENMEIDEFSISIRSAVESLGLARVIKEVGLQAVIKEVGLQAVIKEVGLQAVIKEVGLQAVIKEVGLQAVIKEIGLQAVIKEVGLQAVIAEFKKFKDHLTEEEKEELRKLLD
jgi:hypothetical protein